MSHPADDESNSDALSEDAPRPAGASASRTDRIGNYEILGRLGQGGMGVVFRGRDVRLGRLVALKSLPPDLERGTQARERLLLEARAASALDHPNIGTVYGIEERDEQLYVVMAFYDGETLADRIRRGPLPPGAAIPIAMQVAQGLGAAHSAGLVHRDIKPSNLIVTRQGLVKIIDFGLAKLSDSARLTTPGAVMGTAAYMSPEQTLGQDVDHRSDIWSLGVVLYEMLSGQLPFFAPQVPAILLAILHAPPRPLPGLAPELQQILDRTLAKEPASRYPAMTSLLADLHRLPEPLRGPSAASPIMPPPIEVADPAGHVVPGGQLQPEKQGAGMADTMPSVREGQASFASPAPGAGTADTMPSMREGIAVAIGFDQTVLPDSGGIAVPVVANTAPSISPEVQFAATLAAHLPPVPVAPPVLQPAPVQQPVPLPLYRRTIGRIVLATFIAAVALAIGLIGQRTLRRKNLAATPKALVVLAFRNIGGDPSGAALCDGLMETLTSRLVALETLQDKIWVLPADTVRRQQIDSPEAAHQKLGAELVLTGSLQRQAQAIRLTINLVRPGELRPLGAAVLDEPSGDFVTLQDATVVEFGKLLDLGLQSGTAHTDSGGRTSVEPVVYEAYLTGLGYLQRWDRSDALDAAERIFKDVVARAPRFAPAHVALGKTIWLRYLIGKDSTLIAGARQHAQAALDIDTRLISAHVLLGLIHAGTAARDLAITEFQEVLKLDPRNTEALGGLGLVYEGLGRLSDAEASFKKASALHPRLSDPLNNLGWFYLRHERYPEADAAYRQAIERTPDNAVLYSNLGVVRRRLRDFTEATRLFEKSIRLNPSFFAYTNLSLITYDKGDYRRTAELLEKALQLNDKAYDVWGTLGLARELSGAPEDSVRAAYQRAVALGEALLKTRSSIADVLAYVGYYHAKLGHRDVAREHLERSLALDTSNNNVLIQVAEGYETLGARQEALRIVNQALSQGLSPETLKTNVELRKLMTDPAFHWPPR